MKVSVFSYNVSPSNQTLQKLLYNYPIFYFKKSSFRPQIIIIIINVGWSEGTNYDLEIYFQRKD